MLIGSPTTTRTWIRRLTTGCPAIGRSGIMWWRNRESNPAGRSCKDHLQPAAFPVLGLVPGVGFEPTSPRFRRGAVTRSAFQAGDCAVVANWCGRGESNSFRRSGAPALNQSTTSAKPSVRGASPRIRTSRRPTCRFHRRRFYKPVVGQGRNGSGGGLRVRTPVHLGPLGFRDRLPATPAEPSSRKNASVSKYEDGQGGWIRTNGLLRPRQALLALLSYTLLAPRAAIGAP